MKTKRGSMNFVKSFKVLIRSIMRFMSRSMRGRVSGFIKGWKLVNVDGF
jgi:hypothetical protein